MPVQINELIIRTVVDPSNGQSNNNCVAPGNTDGTGNSMTGNENDIAEQILEIIKEKKQR